MRNLRASFLTRFSIAGVSGTSIVFMGMEHTGCVSGATARERVSRERADRAEHDRRGAPNGGAGVREERRI